MTKIKNIFSREIIDSRGNPTIECDVLTDDSFMGRSSIPSGASKGIYEAVEIRDNDKKRFFGKGVLKSINKINNIISKNLIGISVFDQKKIDDILITLDGTKDKSNLGSNTILAVSLACARTASISKKNHLYEYLGDKNSILMPVPMMNIINGGVHADNKIDIQEFMIAPIGAKSFKEAVQVGCEIFHTLKLYLSKLGFNTNVGDEGGFAPDISSTRKAIEIILESINKAGYKSGSEVMLSLDVASSEFYKNNQYHLLGENKSYSSLEMCNFLKELSLDYPIYSIEDGMAQNDTVGWIALTKLLGDKIQLVGDDLFVTNPTIFKKGINKNIANSILVKPNQIGTITETIDVIKIAKKNGYSCVISHRSGETEDSSIADISVAFNCGQIKTGSLSRTDRLSKYNQLIRIEENLGNKSKYAANNILNTQKG